MSPKCFRSLLAVALAVFAADCRALGDGDNWGVAPYLGIYNPSLKSLNKGEFLSPYVGTANLIDQFGNNNNVSVPFVYRAPLPALSPGAIAGLEFKWRINDKNVLLLGGGNWQSTSSATSQGLFPIQGAFESVISQRKGDLSFTEFYVGWRYNFIHKPKRHDLYFDLSIHDVFNVNYREDFSVLFLSGPPRSFRKSMVVQSRATGLLLLQGGGGGEWFLTDWLSVGAEAGYTFGFKSIRMGNGDLVTDFKDTDNLFLELPLVQTSTGTMQYKEENGLQYREFRLSFEGWKALLKATIYF